MRHTTDYTLSSPARGLRSPKVEGGSPALYGLLAVSALLGFAIVPGGALLATLMILAACGWVLWTLLSAAGSLIKRLVVATAAAIGRWRAERSGRVADSRRWSSPSFRQGEQARSGV
jgi:hypothetical protein